MKNDSTFPAAFTNEIEERLGSEFTRFVEAHEVTPPVSIRLNPIRKHTAQEWVQVAWCENGRYLQARPIFTLDPSFHAGAYYVQEASSMFLEQVFKQVIPNNEPLRILDLCAAPGGKSTHILSLINKESLLVSNEVIKSRVNILIENIQKWGHPNVAITNNDTEDFTHLTNIFDVIVVDAPCSGEGLFRKDIDARSEWSPQHVAMCASRQKRILEKIWPCLKPNGILVYSTCTYNPEENEYNLEWIAQQHSIEFIELTLEPHWGVEQISHKGTVGYRFYPHRVKGEGFFLSVIRKTGPTEEEESFRTGKSTFGSPSKKTLEQLVPWVNDIHEVKIIQRENLIQLLPANHAAFIELLSKQLRLLYAGTFVANLKHDKLVPEHSFALSKVINQSHFPTVTLQREDALKYLRRESLVMELPFKGLALATFEGNNLGWMNAVPGRINNLYPQEWRIRMQGS